MADLVRVGFEVDTRELETGARRATSALDQLGQKVEEAQAALKQSGASMQQQVVEPLRVAERQFRAGQLTVKEYREGLRTALADLRAFGAQTKLTAEQQTALSAAIKQGESQLRALDAQTRRVTSGMTRAAFGVQSLALSMQNGRLSAQGLLGALTMMGIGSPAFLAITAGLAAIGALLASVGDKAAEAAEKIEDAANRARGSVGDMNDARLRGNIERLEAKQRGGELILGSGIFTGGSLTPAEAALLNSARAELASRGRRGRGGRQGAGPRFGVGDPRLGDLPPLPLTLGGPFFSDLKGPGKDGLQALTGGPKGEGLTSFMKPLDELNDKLTSGAEAFQTFGNAAADAFGALIDAAANGGNVLQAFFRAGLAALAKEARAKAIFELAEGFASLFSLTKGGPAGAASHFKAAALYGSAAMALGFAGAGGGGGGGGGGGRTSPTAGREFGPAGDRPVQHIYLVASDGRQLAPAITIDQQRLQDRGVRVAGATARIEVPDVAVVALRA